jgi:rubrerythrin
MTKKINELFDEREGGMMEFKVELDIYEYYCGECSEGFYLESLKSPSILVCPHCGEGEEVSIHSRHLSELINNED